MGFYALLLFATAYAVRRGGGPERWTAAALLMATVATWVAVIGVHGSHAGHFIAVEHAVLAIDSLLVVALLGIALAANRFWPLWMTALHAFGVVGHIAKAMAPEILPNVYQAAHLFSAYPGLALLIWATARHRDRIARLGQDRCWSICSWPWTRRVPASGPTG